MMKKGLLLKKKNWIILIFYIHTFMQPKEKSIVFLCEHLLTMKMAYHINQIKVRNNMYIFITMMDTKKVWDKKIKKLYNHYNFLQSKLVKFAISNIEIVISRINFWMATRK